MIVYLNWASGFYTVHTLSRWDNQASGVCSCEIRPASSRCSPHKGTRFPTQFNVAASRSKLVHVFTWTP